MTAGEPEGSGNTLTASPWGTQESGAGGLQGGERAGGNDTGKSPSAATNKEGAQSRHGARPGQGEKTEVGRKIQEEKPQECGVAPESPRVGEEKGGRKASRVAGNPEGGRHGVGLGVESLQGADTPGVAEDPWGDKTPVSVMLKIGRASH